MPEIDRATRVKRELFLRVLLPTKPPPAVARQLVTIMVDRRYEAGNVIYEKGGLADTVYVLVEGEVELVGDEGDEPWRFGAGSIIGVIDMNAQRPRARTAVALGPVEMLVVGREGWFEVFEDNLEYSSQVRTVQGKALHQFRLELGADGGFDRRQLTPEQALEAAVVEGTMVERLVALRAALHLETTSVQSIAELAKRAELLRASRGDILLSPGGAGNAVYFVLAGMVDVERRVAPPLSAGFGPGDLVLGGAAFAGGLNEYAVTARSDATLLRLYFSDLDDVAEDHFELVRAMLRGVALEREGLMGLRARRQRKASIPPPSAQKSEPEPAKRAG